MMESEQLPERSGGDYAHVVTKALFSAVPVIGGPAAELFALVIAPPLEKRRDAWLQQLYERLKRLEEQIRGFRIEDLQNNESFISVTIHATRIAIGTHEREKLEALRNAVVNVVRGRTLDSEMQIFFLALIDAFTVAHLELLRLFANRAAFPRNRLAELRSRRALTDPIVLDLNFRGLLQDPRPFAARSRESSEALLIEPWAVSRLGHQFVEFISEAARP